MDKNSLTHTRWECKYHIVFASKNRRQIIYGKIKRDVGKVTKDSTEIQCIRSDGISEREK